MLVAASPLPCLPSSSLQDNPHQQQQSDSPCVSAGRAGEHQAQAGIIIIIIIIPHHPVQRFLLLLLPCRTLPLFHRQPSSPGDARFDPGRWMAVCSADLHPLVYLIIKLLILLTTPRPLPRVR